MNVWKYTISDPVQVVEMPEGATILSAHNQREQVCIWALVDPSKPNKPRTIEVIGTGWEVVPLKRSFISTVMLSGGALCFHVFERTP